jgi:ATP-dependent helicase/nuclease subunit B
MPVVLRHQAPVPALPPAERIARGASRTFLIVVPTRRRTRHLARELIGRMPGGTGPHPHLHTLETLATAIFRELYSETGIIARVTQAILFRQAIQKAGPDFRYFSPRKGAFPLQRGTFETITSVITHLKERGITPAILAEELDLAEPDEVHKLRDVIDIYEKYESALAASGRTDTGGMFQTLALGCTQEQFTRVFRAVFPEADFIAVAGFDEFSEPEIGFLRKLQALPGLSVDLIFDFLPGNPSLFGHLEENYRRFLELGLREPPDGSEHAWHELVLGRDTGSHPAGPALNRLSDQLFSGAIPAARISLTERVTLVRARDRGEEAELVCRMIKRMVLADPEMDLSRVCVAMHAPAAYTPIFRKMFARYGLPVNITDRYDLSRSPLVVSLFGLLQVAARGFRREDVLRVADTPYFARPPGSPRRGHILADVSGRLKIAGGYETWRARINAAIDEVERRPGISSVADPSARENAEHARLLLARKEIEDLHADLEPLMQPMTPAGFASSIRTLLDRLRVRENLLASAPDVGNRERDVRACARLLDVLAEMTSALASTEGEETEHALAFYQEMFTVAVSAERYNVREQFGRGVLVTAIEETRGLSMEVMFLVGLVDGEFPSVYQPEIFYSMARQKLRAQRHTWEQRYLFYQAVTNWTRRLVLTVPEQEGELELVRSSFIDALLDIADVAQQTATELMAPGEILSEADLLRFVAVVPESGYPLPADLQPQTQENILGVTRSAYVERSRLQTHALPSYEGLIGDALPEVHRAALHALRDSVFSVSQLESYGTCPFQFFGARVLRLRPPGDFREDLSPLERGSLIHEILFAFMTGRKARGLPDIWLCTDEEAAEAEADLLRIAEDRLARVDLPDPFWEADREALLGTPLQRGLLQEFLRVERERETPLHARFFEVAFGPRMTADGLCDRELSSDEPVVVGTVRLRGRVDRVETGTDVFSIIDYKTGTTHAGLADIRAGMSLQLPLYLRAVQGLLASRLHLTLTPAAGLHYQLAGEVKLSPVLASNQQRGVAFGAASRSRQIVPTDEDLRLLIDGAVARAGDFVEGMSGGVFPLTSPDRIASVCRSCDLKTVCRIQSAYYIPREQEEPT